MAARIILDISEGFYESFSPQLANLRCVNLVPFVPESPAYSATGLRSTEGLVQKVDTGLGIGRGSIRSGTTPFFVQGKSLLSITQDGTITNYGAITGTGPVSMAQNGTILWVVVPNGDSFFLVISTGVLTKNVDPNFLGPATSVQFISGFFVFTTDDLFFNANLDGTTFTPTDFGVAEINPDKIVRGLADHNQLYILGTETIQVFKAVGGSGFPFQTIGGAVIERGLSARFGIVRADNTFFFMGGGGNEESAIYRFTGPSVVKISTPAIDSFIQGLSADEIESCVADTWATGGEEFIQFSFSSRTFVYLVSSSAKKGRHIWTEKETNGSQHRGTAVIEAFKEILFLDTLDSKIGVLDPKTFTEYGETKSRLFSTQPFAQDGKVLFANSYEMVMETGVGNDATENPVLNSRYSNNGINFFQTIARSIGGKGEFDTRVVWRRMGRIPRQRVLEFEITEPCSVTFYRIEAEIDG